MKTFSIGALIAAAAALGLSILCTFTLDNALSWTDRVNLIFDPASAESFDAYYFAFGTLPRFAAAAIGGALLGLVGSLLQQLTQNPMTSPLTLGTSSGGWLAVVLISAFFPAAAGAWLSLGAFAGALAAFGLILLIAGPRGMTGVALIIAGMVVNLLFGAIATAVVLLRAQFVENVFLWGAGDLAQNGWGGITALLPQTVPVVILLLIFAPRALALISLGDEGARARGLPIVPVFGVLAALGIWLSSAFIAAAGVINFTGLIAPNIARRVGFVNPRTQLCVSMLIGAALLCATDAAAQGLTSLTGNIVPTGVVSAIIGTPIFIWIARKSLSALARGGAQPGQASGMVRSSLKKLSIPGLIMLAAAMLLLIVLNFTFINREGIWTFALADKFELLLRIPRFITAAAAGAGLAAAGVILQRLIRNPLASPDILGVSSGAAFAMVVSALYFGGAVGSLGSLTAAGGSFVVLLVLLGLSKSSRFSPDVVVLMCDLGFPGFRRHARAFARNHGKLLYSPVAFRLNLPDHPSCRRNALGGCSRTYQHCFCRFEKHDAALDQPRLCAVPRAVAHAFCAGAAHALCAPLRLSYCCHGACSLCGTCGAAHGRHDWCTNGKNGTLHGNAFRGCTRFLG